MRHPCQSRPAIGVPVHHEPSAVPQVAPLRSSRPGSTAAPQGLITCAMHPRSPNNEAHNPKSQQLCPMPAPEQCASRGLLTPGSHYTAVSTIQVWPRSHPSGPPTEGQWRLPRPLCFAKYQELAPLLPPPCTPSALPHTGSGGVPGLTAPPCAPAGLQPDAPAATYGAHASSGVQRPHTRGGEYTVPLSSPGPCACPCCPCSGAPA